ncbi:ribonuclease domain-containing protein [Xanthomonas sp. NCPPB 2654]|uniref:ribonuclease domain-containing protein n=1 Tax=unclassified Xanthomonas TaxID=2643310 RepID=UPI0021DFAD48|nr:MULTISPECIES: ribonuclease domain-containing protein [unclassified Xanthomonas]MDL5366265.1 ribonuclease domain-containing protein [Xanthomonas sp. NCPPB 2654]UYC19065.1 ribonuclease [Xanthomonas sp. CFBP 8443]
MRKPVLLIAAIVLLAAGLWGIRALQQPPHPQFAPALTNPAAPPAPAPRPPTPPASSDPLPPFLPPEARATIALIQRGGPFPHRQDGSVFGNRENRLPSRPRGYYREYTVDTPGLEHRGTRRIVTGGDPPDVWYYSDDHYASFRSFSIASGRPSP